MSQIFDQLKLGYLSGYPISNVFSHRRGTHDNIPGILPLVRKIVSTGLHNTLPPVNQLLNPPLKEGTRFGGKELGHCSSHVLLILQCFPGKMVLQAAKKNSNLWVQNLEKTPGGGFFRSQIRRAEHRPVLSYVCARFHRG